MSADVHNARGTITSYLVISLSISLTHKCPVDGWTDVLVRLAATYKLVFQSTYRKERAEYTDCIAALCSPLPAAVTGGCKRLDLSYGN